MSHGEDTFKSAQDGSMRLGFMFTTKWEREFDYEKVRTWMIYNAHIPWNISLIFYLSALYLGQKWMKNREPFNIKGLMMVWNSFLALFSVIGFIKVFPEFYNALFVHGFRHSICANTYTKMNEVNFWYFLFTFSKIPELIDTFFLVLRKQKLIFLHVYHHSSVLVLSWFIYSSGLGVARWCTNMNLAIHAIMYSYYALKAVPHIIKIPRWISMLITTLQTLQMVIGTYAVGLSYYLYLVGEPCHGSTFSSILGFVIYLSYFGLFSHFFYRNYIAPTKRDQQTTNSVAEKKRV